MQDKKNNGNFPTAEDRAMEFFADTIIQKLEQLKDNVKWEKPWFSGVGLAWPKNLSGRPYNGMNAVVLKMVAEKNNYELPVWATFNRLTSLNYKDDPVLGPIPLKDKDGNPLTRVMVNKGEKSTPVVLTAFTVINKETKERISYEDYRALDLDEKEKYKVYPKLLAYHVFNVSQSNLKEARPELWAKLVEQNKSPQRQNDGKIFSIPEVDAMVEKQQFYCPILHENKDTCFYSISRDIVQMQPKETFKSGEAYVNNLFHECSHALGAENRLGRFTKENMSKPNFQADEELTAELSAALISSKYGLEKSIKMDSVPYLKSWLDSLHEQPSYIKNVLTDVKKTSYMLMDRLEEVKKDMEQEKTEGRTAATSSSQVKDDAAKDQQDVAAKAVTESPQEEQEQPRHRGFRR